ncbi:hypothetical protein XBJ2_1930037 [Xenorhabdus bovienii str. Jollieti]|uniref:Uncharacterized protein n=1 Tax=Xenorhabdus bovienii (strain SS-2004) TaxID=406818 RepID=D3V5N9_XENBS|nr:hypothetical protein XBJ1_3850 [Xenorhabdus bovienii SS-2004]CDH28721.1 hypothetical protein XBJ2_1930037 [Xenorhabdus bovienii str. Jollieti]
MTGENFKNSETSSLLSLFTPTLVVFFCFMRLLLYPKGKYSDLIYCVNTAKNLIPLIKEKTVFLV